MTDIDPSPRNCFLHPRLSAAFWHESEHRCRSLEQQRDRMQRSLDEARQSVESARDEADTARLETEKSNDAIRTLTRELLATRLRLDEANKQLLELEAFRNEIDAIIAERDSALAKLRTVSSNLADARAELRRVYGLPEHSELIDWDESDPEQPRTPQFPPENYPKPPEPEPQSPPESSDPSESSEKSAKSETSETSESSEEDDTDWLTSLPSNQL